MHKLRDGFKGERAVILPPHVLRELESDSFCRQLHVTDIGYYPCARYHYRTRTPGISQCILICCVKGRGWVEVGGEHFDVLPNRYIIIPAYTPHTYGADATDPWTIYWMHFKGEMVEAMELPVNRLSIFAASKNSKVSGLVGLHEEMLNTLQMGCTAENLHYTCGCLYHFLGALKFNSLRQHSNHQQSEIIVQTIHLLEESVAETLTSEEIAARLGYSYSHLSSVFTKGIGCSPCTFFMRLKVQKACQYLDFTEMKINEICFRVGIEDAYYFSRMFTRVMGMSPRAYRLQPKG